MMSYFLKQSKLCNATRINGLLSDSNNILMLIGHNKQNTNQPMIRKRSTGNESKLESDDCQSCLFTG